MDFDRTCIIKVFIAAFKTPVLKPILSANAKVCFFGSVTENPNSLRGEDASQPERNHLSKNNSFPWKWILTLTLSR
jgi:hypothetical protein